MIKTTAKQLLEQYEQVCQNIANSFVIKYYGEKYFNERPDDYGWIGSEIGGVFYLSDLFLSVDNMLDYMRYAYTRDMMFEHYWADLEARTDEKTIPNIKNWKHMLK